MERSHELYSYVRKLEEKMGKSEDQWRGNRFASSYDGSDTEPDDEDDEIENQSYLEKYRGKNGDVKPLGLVLYYQYLRSLSVLFFLLTLLSLPSILVYSQNKGLAEFSIGSSFSKSILLLSIANLPRYRLDLLTQEQLSEVAFHRNLTIACDTACVFLVMGFILHWKVASTKTSNQYTSRSPRPYEYCLKVKEVSGCSEQDLRTHFTKFGKVAQISCIYSYRDIMIDLRSVVKLVARIRLLKPDEQKYEETMEKIDRRYWQLAEKYLSMPQPKIIQSFVVFETVKTRNKVADLYKYQIYEHKLPINVGQKQGQVLINMGEKSGTLPNISSFKDEVIGAQEGRDRSDQIKRRSDQIKRRSDQIKRRSDQIKRRSDQIKKKENRKIESSEVLKDSRSEKQQEGIGTVPSVIKCRYEPLTINWENCNISKKDQRGKFIFQAVLVMVMISMILMALFLLNISSTHVKEKVMETEPLMDNFDLEKLEADKQMAYTFCSSLTYSNFKWDYYKLCENYFQLERNRFAIMLLFALMVAVINLMTNRILWALVAFRRYKTLAGRNRFLIISIFLFSLINSAILLLMVRGSYTGPILRKVVGYILGFPEQVMQVTIYPEFNRQWYMNIGSQLMVNYSVSLIVFPHFHLFLHWARAAYRKMVFKKTGKLQKNPNFNYCTFYALSLKAIFFALLYSNCMPVFYFLCFLSLTVQTYVGKTLLANFVDEPVFVDNNAIQVAVSIIPYGLLLHCFTSVLFINVDDIFPTKDSYVFIEKSWWQQTLFKFQSSPGYFFLMVIIMLFIWNRARIEKILISYWLGRRMTSLSSLKFSEIRNNPAFLASYKMRDNPKYKILYHALTLFQAHMKIIKQNRERDEAEKMLPKDQPTSANFMKDGEKTDNNLNQASDMMRDQEIRQFQHRISFEREEDGEDQADSDQCDSEELQQEDDGYCGEGGKQRKVQVYYEEDKEQGSGINNELESRQSGGNFFIATLNANQYDTGVGWNMQIK